MLQKHNVEQLIIAIIRQTCLDYIKGDLKTPVFEKKIKTGWASMVMRDTDSLIEFCKTERLKKVGSL